MEYLHFIRHSHILPLHNLHCSKQPMVIFQLLSVGTIWRGSRTLELMLHAAKFHIYSNTCRLPLPQAMHSSLWKFFPRKIPTLFVQTESKIFILNKCLLNNLIFFSFFRLKIYLMCYFSQINSPFFDLWRLHHTSASTIFGSTNVSTGSCLLISATISSFWQCQNQSLPLYKTSHFYGRATRNLHAFVATIGSSISRLFIDVSQRYPRIRV